MIKCGMDVVVRLITMKNGSKSKSSLMYSEHTYKTIKIEDLELISGLKRIQRIINALSKYLKNLILFWISAVAMVDY